MPDDAFRDDDLTPPPVDLSAPLVQVTPTMEGLANAIMRVHAQVVVVQRQVTAFSRECEFARKTCPAVLAHDRQRRRSGETRQAHAGRWDRWGKRLSVIASALAIVGMLGTAWWWTASFAASMRQEQAALKATITKELRASKRAQRRNDHAMD